MLGTIAGDEVRFRIPALLMATLPELGLVRSEDLDEVLAAVDYDHAPYAGGTELVPAMGIGAASSVGHRGPQAGCGAQPDRGGR